MQDSSLKFFSRNVQFSQSEELFLAEYKNRPFKDNFDGRYRFEAIGLLTCLQMLLFSDQSTGFYYDVSGDRFHLLANKLGVSPKQLSRLLNCCFKYSILDKEFYQKYQILTSYKMQDDYSKVLDKPQDRVRAQNINLDYVYQDCDFTQKYKNALQKYKNAVQKRENAVQKMGDKTIQDKNINNDNLRKETNLDIQNFNSSLQKFKNNFPNKKCDDDIAYTPGIDFELLTKCINESPQFLLKFNNPFNWKWCIDHYKAIIEGKYRKFPEVKQENQPKHAVQNFKGRDYTGKDLNDLFDDIESIELDANND